MAALLGTDDFINYINEINGEIDIWKDDDGNILQIIDRKESDKWIIE